MYHTSGKPTKHVGTQLWDRHIEYLREVVPPEKLVFFDVRDGWEPLCKALGCEVPKGIDFPQINERAGMESFAREQVRQGLIRWIMIIGTVVAAIVFCRLWLR